MIGSKQKRQVIEKLRRAVLTAALQAEIGTFPGVALEAIETPSSPVRMAMLLTICSLFIVSIGVAWLCRVDIHAVVQGKIQSVGRSKVVQPLDPGRVSAVYVKNGSHVRQGQEIVLLDPTEVIADQREHAQQLNAYRAEIARRYASIAAAESRRPSAMAKIQFDADIDSSLQVREQAVMIDDLNQLNASLASLESKRAESMAQRESLIHTIAAESQLIGTLSQRLSMRQALEEQHWETASNVLDAKEAFDRENTSKADHEGQLLVAEATAASVTRQKVEAIAKFVSENSEALAAAEAKRDDVAQELVKSAEKSARTRIVAPIEGTVQELSVTTLGQVVGRGQQLMVIVPSSAPIEIEALVSNSDIGFIHVGQDVAIKIDTFPYTIFGTVPGKVVTVSRDAIYTADPRQSLPTAEQATEERESSDVTATASTSKTHDLVFPITVAPNRSTILVGAKDVALSPGMTVQVEILTGRRRVMDYILSPLREIGSEALHER